MTPENVQLEVPLARTTRRAFLRRLQTRLPAFGALLLLTGLSGCRNRDFENLPIGGGHRSRADKFLHTDHIDKEASGLPVVQAAPGGGASPAGSGGDGSDDGNDPGADVNPDVQDMTTDDALDNSYMGDSREHAHSWWGVFDIYWMLNGARRQLLTGNVPRNLPAIVLRERRHSERLAHENLDYKPDPFWKLSPSLTIAQCLEPANSALAHLDAGLNHIKQNNLMQAAGLSANAIPWGRGEAEVQRYFERNGLAAPAASDTPASPLPPARRSEDDDPVRAPVAAFHTFRAPLNLSERQQQAVALALRYEKDFRASPEASARKEFEAAMRDTLKLRECLNLRYVRARNHVMGDDIVIAGPLHLEGGAFPPEAGGMSAPPPPPPAADIDPFRTSP